MLGLMNKCLETFLSGEGKERPGLGEILFLDTSNGLVDGYCYLIFEKGRIFPSYVMKCAKTITGKHIYREEFENLMKLQDHGLNHPYHTVPSPLGRWEIGDAFITLQTALQGPLMKNVHFKQIFSQSKINNTLSYVMEWLYNFSFAFGLQKKTVDEEIYKEIVLKEINLFRNRYLLTDTEKRFLIERLEEKRNFIGQTVPLVFRHGDFCTANIIMTSKGTGVIDWEFPLEFNIPLFDIFYFFSSLRFPFKGLRSESNHLDSFLSVFWGNNYVHETMCELLHDMCSRFEIPEELVGDLFVISLIQVANMKYDGLVWAHGYNQDAQYLDPVSETNKKKKWESFLDPDMNVPFACIKNGVHEQFRETVNRGVPTFK